MGDSLAVNARKLEWSGRLCAVLLNDGTDVLRWFLKENLPRNYGDEPNLNKVRFFLQCKFKGQKKMHLSKSIQCVAAYCLLETSLSGSETCFMIAMLLKVDNFHGAKKCRLKVKSTISLIGLF